jgi:hypothetical protein
MPDDRHIPGGVVHDLPDDLKRALELDQQALLTWQDITPLARNEWICWIESAKMSESRRFLEVRLWSIDQLQSQIPVCRTASCFNVRNTWKAA